MNNFKIEKNKYGYYEVVNKPGKDELADFYAKNYFQKGMGAYEKDDGYSNEERRYFLNKIKQKHIMAQNLAISPKQTGRFLDVGAGEGWALQYFSDAGWNVYGLDYSQYGCLTCNPKQVENLVIGDMYANLYQFIETEQKFDLILLDNVLEHVLDPLQLLSDLKKITSETGLLIVEVPNDFSIIQQQLIDKGYVSREYWVALPDHLSYFNKDGLIALAEDAGWNSRQTIADYPIDFNLFNTNTNYIENKAVGKSCHYARVELENLMHDISPEKVNTLYEAYADLGLGRQLVTLLSL